MTYSGLGIEGASCPVDCRTERKVSVRVVAQIHLDPRREPLGQSHLAEAGVRLMGAVDVVVVSVSGGLGNDRRSRFDSDPRPAFETKE